MSSFGGFTLARKRCADSHSRPRSYWLMLEGSIGSTQWGQRLEGWPNTASRLACWRRVTRVWFCMWWPVHAACHDVPHHLFRCWADLLLNVHKTPSWVTSHMEGMAWYSSWPMPSLWVYPSLWYSKYTGQRLKKVNSSLPRFEQPVFSVSKCAPTKSSFTFIASQFIKMLFLKPPAWIRPVQRQLPLFDVYCLICNMLFILCNRTPLIQFYPTFNYGMRRSKLCLKMSCFL
jgi:hypothetical protein